MVRTIAMLILSNIFMTIAWYGHLKNLKSQPFWIVILISWGIAFFEYCLQVPANRIGSSYFTLSQLKVLQELITMTVFTGFSIFYMGAPVTRNFAYASICIILAAWFIFRDGVPQR